MSKLNVVRQIKDKRKGSFYPNPEQEKEQNWDNRFHLGKLPEYDAFTDNNYLSMKMLREQIRQLDHSHKMKKGDNSQDRTNKNNYIYENLKDMDNYNEELNVVQSMWDDLGVTEEYKYIFDTIARELDEISRKQFFDLEISSLMRLSENLSKLSKEIQSREKTISMLKKFNEALSRDNEFVDKIINDVIQCIKNIRIQSINIVNHFTKIREICSYNVLGGKFDLEKINKVYLFDRNYLIKMKFDLEFLKNSYLANYFNFYDERDPFLLSTNDDESKYSVNINPDMMNSIKQSQFLIMQDMIFYQIQNMKMNNKKTNNKSKSPIYKLNYPLAKEARSRVVTPNINNMSQTSRPTSFGFYNLNVNKNNKQYNNLFFTKDAPKEVNNYSNVNNLKNSMDKSKRIQIETKEKDLGKTQENFKTFEKINSERLKINQMKQKEQNQKVNNNFDENLLYNTYSEKKSPQKVKIEKVQYDSKKDKIIIDSNNYDNNYNIKETNSKLQESSHVNNKNISKLSDNIIVEKKEESVNYEVDMNPNMEIDFDDNYNFNELKDDENDQNYETKIDVKDHFDNPKLKEDSKIHHDTKHEEPFVTDMDEIKSFSNEANDEIEMDHNVDKSVNIKTEQNISNKVIENNIEESINNSNKNNLENNNHNILKDENKNDQSVNLKINKSQMQNETNIIKDNSIIKTENNKIDKSHLKTENNKQEIVNNLKTEEKSILKEKQEIVNNLKTEEKSIVKDKQEIVNDKIETKENNNIDKSLIKNLKTEEKSIHKITQEKVNDIIETNENKKIDKSINNIKTEQNKVEESIHIKTEVNKQIENVKTDNNKKVNESIHIKTDNNKNVNESIHIKTDNNKKVNESIHIKTDNNKKVNESIHIKTDNNKKVNESIHIKTDNNKKVNESIHIKTDNNKKVNESIHIKTDNNKIIKTEEDLNEHKKEEDNIVVEKDKKIQMNSEVNKEEDVLASEVIKGEDFLDLDKKEEVKEELPKITKISLSYLTSNLNEFQSEYSNYLKDLSEDQQKAFRPDQSIHSYQRGYNPKILLAKDNDKLIGLCCLSYDSNHDTSLRLYVNQMTTILNNRAEEIFQQFKEFLFNNFQFDEIMIEIHYEHINESFVMNKYLFTILKDNLKFRWSNLENKTSKDRLQKMNIKRERNEEEINRNKIYKHNLRLINGTVIKINDYEGKRNEENLNKTEENNINVFPLMYSLLELTEHKYKLENENFNNFNTQKLKNLTKDIINFQSGDNHKIIKFLEENNINSNKLNSDMNNELNSCVLQLYAKFNSSLTSILRIENCNYLYNRIEQTKCESLIDGETQQIFHVIPTGDGINSIIIAELNQKFKEMIKNLNKNLCQIFFDLYPRLESVIPLENSSNDTKVIWIPCFNLQDNSDFINPNLFSDVLIKKDSQDYKIETLNEFKNFSFINDPNYSHSFTLSPGVNDIIIKDDFLISIVNFDILTELHIPSIYLQLITMKQCV